MGGADEREKKGGCKRSGTEKKVAGAKKRWLQQRSLGGQKKRYRKGKEGDSN